MAANVLSFLCPHPASPQESTHSKLEATKAELDATQQELAEVQLESVNQAATQGSRTAELEEQVGALKEMSRAATLLSHLCVHACVAQSVLSRVQ